MGVAQVGRQQWQPDGDVEAVAVPAQERVDGEGVAEVVVKPMSA